MALSFSKQILRSDANQELHSGSETIWKTEKRDKQEVRLTQLEMKLDNLKERIIADKEATEKARTLIIGTILAAVTLILTGGALVYNVLKDSSEYYRNVTVMFFNQLTEARKEFYQYNPPHYFLPQSSNKIQ